MCWWLYVGESWGVCLLKVSLVFIYRGDIVHFILCVSHKWLQASTFYDLGSTRMKD